MKMGKPIQSRITDDFAPDLATRVIAKLGMPALQQAYRLQPRCGIRIHVAIALEPLGAEDSEIDAVSAIVEQTVSESVLIPAGMPTGASYSIFLEE